MQKLPDLQDVNTDQQNGGLQEMLTYDRVTAARLGQTPQSLDSSLYSAFGQSEVSVIYTQLNQYYVVMEVAPQYWQDPSGLNNIYFTPGKSSIARRAQHGFAAVHRGEATDQHDAAAGKPHRALPFGHRLFNLRNGVSLSDATREVTRDGATAWACRQQCADSLPEPRRPIRNRWRREPIPGHHRAACGLHRARAFCMRAWSTRSPSSPRCLSASVGAMLALMLFHIDLNVISIIGIILLIGIVKKNAIMMIDFALQAERQEGKNTRDAIFEACMLRFRPIMMTTMSAICGALPLAFGTGTGSELRRPLGITIVGGLLLEPVAHALHHSGGLPV